MAKEERDEILRERCPCGHGDVVIDRFTLDYAFGRARWEARLICDTCVGTYEVGRPGGHSVTLRNRADITAARELDSRVSEAQTALEADVLRPLRAELVRRVRAAGRTYEHWFHVLRELLDLGGTAADLRGAAQASGSLERWIEEHIDATNAARVATVLGVTVPADARVSMLEERRAARAALQIRTQRYGGSNMEGRVDSTKKTPAGEAVDAAVKGAISGAITHAGDPYAAGLAAAGAIAGHIAAKAFGFARASIEQRRSTDALLGVGSVVELDERAPEIEAKLALLIEAAGNDAGARARAVGSFEAMLEAWMKASRRAADDRKRRILMAALVSGLDEEAYREGLALTVIERLERLDYGAVRLLSRLSENRPGEDDLAHGWQSLESFHADQLAAVGFAVSLRPSSHDVWKVTEFGRVALRFVQEELGDHIREEGNAEAS